jgi:XTP/dITP diphosphohydrolase
VKLLIATNNPGKLIEIQSILADLEVELINPASLELNLEVAEAGQTYQENAALKAQAYASAAGILSLADDSGLEVEALGGRPGLHSARYSPLPKASDADRRAYLLLQLTGFPRPWKAQFRCTVALARPDGQIWFREGICPGEIIPEERGQNGFGYDPVFYLPHLGKTMAELSDADKNQLSHRALALRAVQPVLLEQLRLSRSSRPAENHQPS